MGFTIPTEETGFSAFFGYFLAKGVEWLKTNPRFSWITADTTVIVQFLVALASFAFSFGMAYSMGRPWDWASAGYVLWNALSAWVSAELTYHKTIKNEHMMVQVIQEVNRPAQSGSPPPVV